MPLFINKSTIQISVLEFLLSMYEENPTLINNRLTVFHTFSNFINTFIYLMDNKSKVSQYLQCSIFMKSDNIFGHKWVIELGQTG